jgi:hypothetical protein
VGDEAIERVVGFAGNLRGLLACTTDYTP